MRYRRETEKKLPILKTFLESVSKVRTLVKIWAKSVEKWPKFAKHVLWSQKKFRSSPPLEKKRAHVCSGVFLRILLLLQQNINIKQLWQNLWNIARNVNIDEHYLPNNKFKWYFESNSEFKCLSKWSLKCLSIFQATNMHENAIIVADTGNNRVSVYSKDGNFLHFLGGKSQKGTKSDRLENKSYCL